MDFFINLVSELHKFSDVVLVSLLAHIAFMIIAFGLLYLLLIFPLLGDKKRKDIMSLVKLGLEWAKVARRME